MTSKASDERAGQSKTECCMCGDCGFSEELFLCQICKFRSQHRYCSNLYPKVEGYGTCNWCLTQKDENKDRSSNSSSSYCKNKKIKDCNVMGGQKGSEVRVNNKGIHKRNSAEEKSKLKRIVTNRDLEERLRRRRNKSEDISNTTTRIITRQQVFRNKVRRYKLLDEVST
ncbi:putative chromatin regulator PHD family [Senna tora]|uniref:Putative chromatin regulator PHD family n=1 Tax=Senna tora TaxID=362788 RepID=A0A834T9Z3_9FABA|nr:putative chromatin regulator PHD family [Senna tora]